MEDTQAADDDAVGHDLGATAGKEGGVVVAAQKVAGVGSGGRRYCRDLK